jgi:hypothetical protein
MTMDEQLPVFSGAEPAKKRLKPAFIGIILASSVLIIILLAVLLWIDQKGAKFQGGYTVYPDVIHSGDPGFTDHARYLLIINAMGQVSENYLGGQQAVVTGEIVNDSDTQTVDVVELIVRLLDDQGEITTDFIKTPIKPSLPLKPREIRQFSVWVEPLPPEWLTGTIEVDIHGFRIK